MNDARPALSPLGHKSLTCLWIAHRFHGHHDDYDTLWNEACALYHPRQLESKFNELLVRGYLECGVSARTGWLTAKGREALVGFERRKL